MKALLLAAGLGTRLRPITNYTPKCLVEINGKPVIWYWFNILRRNGFEEIFVNTHWLHQKVYEYVLSSEWSEFVTLLHEEKLLGTGGTIKKNSRLFSSSDTLIAHADNLIDFDLPDFIYKHHNRPANTVMSMLSFECENPRNAGIIERDKNGILVNFHEKSKLNFGNIANAAVYIISPEIIKLLSKFDQEFIDFSNEVIPQLLGKIFTIDINGYLRDIGTVADLSAARKEFIG